MHSVWKRNQMHLWELSREYSDSSVGAVGGRKAADTRGVCSRVMMLQKGSVVGWMIKGMPQPRKVIFTLAPARSQLQ